VSDVLSIPRSIVADGFSIKRRPALAMFPAIFLILRATELHLEQGS